MQEKETRENLHVGMLSFAVAYNQIYPLSFPALDSLQSVTFQMIRNVLLENPCKSLGTYTHTKTDEFSEKLTPSFPIQEFMLQIFASIKGTLVMNSEKNLQRDFPKMRGGVKGRLELFRKFMRFGSGMLP